MTTNVRSESAKRHWAKKRLLWSSSPSEWRALERQGVIAPQFTAHIVPAQEECAALLQAAGGEDHVSEPRRVLIEDLGRSSLMVRALVATILTSETLDADLVSKLTSLITARRQSLLALGLDRVSRELDLASYLKDREAAQDRAGGTNASKPDPSVGSPGERASEATDAEVVDLTEDPVTAHTPDHESATPAQMPDIEVDAASPAPGARVVREIEPTDDSEGSA